MRDPFHDGERAIQEQTGERDIALINGQMIADRIPAAAKVFLTQQRYCLLGGAAADGDLWALLVCGEPGFARTDEARQTLHLRIDDRLGVFARTPPLAMLREGDPLGLLFIELATRRRLRVNGRCSHPGADEWVIAIDQANPLCPKYIQRRQPVERVAASASDAAPADATIDSGQALTEALVEWITTADTFFVASAHSDGSADVSHRGGRPGFVRHQAGVLRIPDYPGNSMFNTLGNFAVNPRAGLSFIDFDGNRQLQMTGDVRLDLAAGAADPDTGGTGRWWEFRPRQWFVSPLNLPLAWTFVDASPFNP